MAMVVATTSSNSSFDKVMFQCPACDRDVRATIQVTVTPSEDWQGGKELTLRGGVTGLSISHDCMPKLTRDTRILRDRPQA